MQAWTQMHKNHSETEKATKALTAATKYYTTVSPNYALTHAACKLEEKCCKKWNKETKVDVLFLLFYLYTHKF